jgi:hypothetical protein
LLAEAASIRHTSRYHRRQRKGLQLIDGSQIAYGAGPWDIVMCRVSISARHQRVAQLESRLDQAGPVTGTSWSSSSVIGAA